MDRALESRLIARTDSQTQATSNLTYGENLFYPSSTLDLHPRGAETQGPSLLFEDNMVNPLWLQT
jgi:hypothetical protein